MRDLTPEFIELIRFTSTNLPEDVERRLKEAYGHEEEGSPARQALETILKNIALARQQSSPICQDTGTPIFYVKYPLGWSQLQLSKQIKAAIIEATKLNYLRPNAVNSFTGRNTGDNSGDDHYPSLHFEEVEDGPLTVELILKGGGCENVGAQYSLPNQQIKADRDLEGVRRAALDAVWRAQGEGCAPGFLGIAVGGDRGSSYAASKEAFQGSNDAENPDPQLAELENRITAEANQLGIGPMGFGGNSTVLGTRIRGAHRLPASFFVTISYMCWAYRRRRMVVDDQDVRYE